MITFAPLADHSYGDAPFVVSASASSGLPVSFAAAGNCTIAAKMVTLTGAGSCTVTASQAGDSTYQAATPVSQGFTIARAATGTTLSAAANPAVVGQTVTFTATVSALSAGIGTPGGTVTFKDGTATLGTGSLTGAGVATFSTASLAVGSHSLTAVYGGAGNFGGSTSGALTELVRYGVTLLYKTTMGGKVGGNVAIKIELVNAAGTDLSAAGLTVHALCVVATPASATNPCAAAPAGFNWTSGPARSFTYLATLDTGGGYQFNLKTTGLSSGVTYQLLFRVAGEDLGSDHVDAGATFTLTK
jgi:hypothetical protein